jgi:GH18 family chitinase
VPAVTRLLAVLFATILSGSVVVGQEKAKEKPADPSPFRLATYLPDYRAADFDPAEADVKAVLDAGAKAEQITLGIPLYGRDRKKAERVVSYRDLVAKHKLEADADEVNGVYFNGPATVRRKVGYAVEKKLAGVMVCRFAQSSPSVSLFQGGCNTCTRPGRTACPTDTACRIRATQEGSTQRGCRKRLRRIDSSSRQTTHTTSSGTRSS